MFFNHAQSSTTTDIICTSTRPGKEPGRLYTVYRNSPRMNSSWQWSSDLQTHSEAQQPVELTSSFIRRAKVATVLDCHFYFSSHSPFYSHKLYLLYLYMRSTDGEKYFIEQSFVFCFFIMLFKCVNLYVERTFSRNFACGRSDTHLSSLRTRPDLDWRLKQIGPVMFISVTWSRRNSRQRSP